MPKHSSSGVPLLEIQSTAGAVQIRNAEGKDSIQKVKVFRYITGKRPEYAPRSSSENESGSEDEEKRNRRFPPQRFSFNQPHNNNKADDDWKLQEPEIWDSYDEEEGDDVTEEHNRSLARTFRRNRDNTESESEEELDEKEIEHRRATIRQRTLAKLQKQEEEELLTKEEEKNSQEDGEITTESEYEECTDSEDDEEVDPNPRSRPMFVRKEERVTLQGKWDEEEASNRIEEKNLLKRQERRKETLKILENKERSGGDDDDVKEFDSNQPKLTDVITDDEETEEDAEFEAWKIRDLKRIKKSKDEKEAFEREQSEIQQLRNMTDEERNFERRMKPKQIDNEAQTGRYKFMQKYYHRGAFFMDKDDELFKRDYSKPTLEDHFNKSTMPRVMQVKNFGKCGQTKWTHLVDQDTSENGAGWATPSHFNMKFQTTRAAAGRQVFQKPTTHKKKKRSSGSTSCSKS